MKTRNIIEGAADGFQALLEGDPATVDCRALRLATMAEYEAVNLYERMAEVVQDEKVKEVLLDVAKEEKVHIGEFEALLNKLDPEHKSAIEDGEKEVGDVEADVEESFEKRLDGILFA